MKAVKGTLVTCDPAVKQLILSINSTERFVIEDLDETHLMVLTDSVQRMREAVDEELEKNTYVLET